MTTNNRHKKIIHNIVTKTHSVQNRINLLQKKGFVVNRCYVKTYNKLLGETIMTRKGVIRIIIGRPKDHYYREVFAVDLPLIISC